MMTKIAISSMEITMTDIAWSEILAAIRENIVGQQSGWFWTMIQSLAVIVSLILIYRQVRAQRVANSLVALEKLAERWNSNRLCDARSAVVSAYPSTSKKIEHHEEILLTFIEELGGHSKKGVLDIDAVWHFYSYYVEHYWPILLEKVLEIRTENQDESYFDQAEWLYDKCCKFSRKRGSCPIKTEAQLATFIKGELNYVEYRIANL